MPTDPNEDRAFRLLAEAFGDAGNQWASAVTQALAVVGTVMEDAARAMRDLGQRFHPELMASHLPEEIITSPEWKRRVIEARAADPETSLAGHMLDVAARMEIEAECARTGETFDTAWAHELARFRDGE